MEYNNEIEMYPDIIKSIGEYMKFNNYEYKVFETWHEFDQELKNRFQKEIEILGDFGKPDITVFYRENEQEEFKVLLIEVKLNDIVLKDIAQAKMYGDIFNADKVFLVAPCDIRRKIMVYYEYNNQIMSYSENREVKYVKFIDKNLQFQHAFPIGGELL